ncbi:MAG TPA: homocysteine S-methyltransferase family protein, partial [Candidatus Polarisedimenticolia bacterium]|nr:homocysteine S-methyltransferase family protein [Candidatus Polarisedimenticolia bacterium]
MPGKPFLEALARGPLVFDGAMGTQLYERGYFISRSFDEANLTRPDLVADIHRDYRAAGAQILETNTFGANAECLKRYGAQDKVAPINRAGVLLAREAAGDAGWVAGSVGPTGLMLGTLSDERRDTLRALFLEQIEVLLESGVDLLVLETFYSLEEIAQALKAARAVYRGAVVAQMAFGEERRAIDGLSPGDVARRLRDLGADVVGANCAEGPAFLFDVAREMLGCGAPVSIQPNAGRPRRLDERTLYMTTPEYFGVYARRLYQSGVALVGGCCGTGPEHIRPVVDAARMLGGGRVEALPPRPAPHEAELLRLPAQPMEERSPLGAKLRRVWRERLDPAGPRKSLSGPESFVVSVEVNPDPGLDPARALAAAALLRRAGVDAINIADGPRAVARMSNLALALRLKERTDAEILLHVCCRDRNL